MDEHMFFYFGKLKFYNVKVWEIEKKVVLLLRERGEG